MAITDSRANVLVAIVDDDRSVLGSLENLLRSTGHRVAGFSSGPAFLASGILAETCCLILDLQMPEMSGHEVFELVAARHPVPVIVITAHGDDPVRARMLRDGAVAFFTKPFRAAEILAAVRAAVKREDG